MRTLPLCAKGIAKEIEVLIFDSAALTTMAVQGLDNGWSNGMQLKCPFVLRCSHEGPHCVVACGLMENLYEPRVYCDIRAMCHEYFDF